jgi:hypothetical protein
MCWRVGGDRINLLMSELATYQQFFTVEEAQPILSLLDEHRIPYTFKISRVSFDKIYVGGVIPEQFDLKIPTDQFERVDALLLENIDVNVDDLEKDHYLLSSTEEELRDMIANPDEWSKQDYLFARELLKRRGIVYTKEQLRELSNKKNEVLAKPEKSIDGGWIALAYIVPIISGIGMWFTSMTILPFWLSFASILIGVSLWKFKKLLPNGTRTWIYQKEDRDHGRNIFFISLAALLSTLIAMIFIF